MLKPKHKPEILAPAGGQEQLLAAVHAGADAVYFGLDRGFNARARAMGIPSDQLADTMALLHQNGCKGYLTLNVLVFDEELVQLEEQIRHAARCGVDALIVQDIGAIALARATTPSLPLHGSTQMSITDAHGLEFAHSLGLERVVVGRELSIEDIVQLHAQRIDVEIETFVHGALCVSYSGQCFSSEAWGGRSANRGQCAQACRLPYGLLVDGQLREQGDYNYLLSPQDLMALPLLPKLIASGIHSFKIEGRLKGPEYVLRTVSAYRKALDELWSIENSPDSYSVSPAIRHALAQTFSRGQDADHDGLSEGFLAGPQHQVTVIGRNPRHRGLYLGQVRKVLPQGVELDLEGPLKAGDGVVFDQGKPQQREPGGNVFKLLRSGKPVSGEIAEGLVHLGFAKPFDSSKIRVGDRIWRSKDSRMDSGPKLHREARYARLGVRVKLKARVEQPLQLTLQDTQGRCIQVHGDQLAQAARGQALSEAAARQAIGQFGDTAMHVEALECDIAPDIFLPVGDIKRARRRAVEQLQALQTQHSRDQAMPSQTVLNQLLPKPDTLIEPASVQIALLCRTAAQVEAALQLPWLNEIMVDFLEVHGLKQACASVRAQGRRLVVAAPRIFKPGEHRLVRYLLGLQADALLVRSTGLLWHLHTHSEKLQQDGLSLPELYGDFSLNAANRLSFVKLLEMGLHRLAPTHDVNASQLAKMAQGLSTEQRTRLELIAHHHLPIFHTEHCVFARFMSKGNSYRDCGRPCERHTVHLRDPGQSDHLLLADIGCRNTVFNAQAQSAAPFHRDLRTAGISHWRIELVDESAEQVAELAEGYRALLNDQVDHRDLWRQLGRVQDANQNAQGVGLGSLAMRIEAPREQMKKPTAR